MSEGGAGMSGGVSGGCPGVNGGGAGVSGGCPGVSGGGAGVSGGLCWGEWRVVLG